jgi:hypothetical protein
MRKFSDPPLTEHEGCGGTLERLLSAPAFQLKGTGWYATDYAKSGAKPAPDGESKPADPKSADSNESQNKGDDNRSASDKSAEDKSAGDKHAGDKSAGDKHAGDKSAETKSDTKPDPKPASASTKSD